jgi:Photoprotection regulator fluorescence recovery protein
MVRISGVENATVFREDEIMRELKWSPSEKRIARRAFDKALKMELQDIMGEAKEMAAAVHEVSQLWSSESWLTQRRVEIDRKYDYRYSVLPLVFARLVKEGRISEKDLHGLDLEKIELIFGAASRL